MAECQNVSYLLFFLHRLTVCMCCVQRHQVKYSFGLSGFQAEHPPPYTTCVQQLPGGAWLLPSVDGDWLCARPTS